MAEPEVANIPAALSASTVTDAFLALLCADDELLRAEFESIVKAAWGEPGKPSRPTRPNAPKRSAQPPDRWPEHCAYSALAVLQRLWYSGADRWCRQRSPPLGKMPDRSARYRRKAGDR